MGKIFEIQRFCVHDGPGIRTTIFFKGCPLRCRWCSNPESQNAGSEFMFSAERCMHCGICLESCPVKAPFSTEQFDLLKCTGCNACIDRCPTEALTKKGQEIDSDSLLREIIRDRIVFEQSGGGVTFSGGEPLMQPVFLQEILGKCGAAGINTCIETTLYADWHVIEPLLPDLSHVLCDIKHPDGDEHRKWTGVDNQKIIENAARLLRMHPDVVVRIPVIPGFNTTPQAHEGFIKLFAELKPPRIELLPYHIYGESKYHLLKREYPGADIPQQATQNAEKALYSALQQAGFCVSVSR